MFQTEVKISTFWGSGNTVHLIDKKLKKQKTGSNRFGTQHQRYQLRCQVRGSEENASIRLECGTHRSNLDAK